MRIHKDELGFLCGSFVLVPQVEKFSQPSLLPTSNSLAHST